MAYEQTLIVRFEDVDFARIVYFPRLFGYCHSVFEDFFRHQVGVPYSEMLQQRKVGYPTVHAGADFKSPLRFGDQVRVVMDTVKLGTRSITNRYRLYRQDPPEKSEKRPETLAAEIEIVTVAIDMDTVKSVDLPEDVRVAFLNHLVNYGV